MFLSKNLKLLSRLKQVLSCELLTWLRCRCGATESSRMSPLLIFLCRELQAIEKGEADSVAGPNSLDKERSLLNDDPKWLETTYVLANYKTEPCKKPPRLCRQGYACPQFHNNKDKRRSPKKFKYR